MSYTAQVYNVMLASPSDVIEEKDVARNIILEWNNINSLTRKIVLLPICWEHNSFPDMGDRPQDVINKQILKNADILVGIFWTRIGTSTGKAVSGTVEEIEEHINSGKLTMLYFSSKHLSPDNIDSEQYDAVKKIKKEYQSRGLTVDFSSIEDFKDKFFKQLSKILNTDKFFQTTLIPNSITDSISNNGLDLLDTISSEAKKLLIEASKDINGEITRLSTNDGLTIYTNKVQFTRGSEPRTMAEWEEAVEELEINDLIKDRGYERQRFQITKKGYTIADELINLNY